MEECFPRALSLNIIVAIIISCRHADAFNETRPPASKSYRPCYFIYTTTSERQHLADKTISKYLNITSCHIKTMRQGKFWPEVGGSADDDEFFTFTLMQIREPLWSHNFRLSATTVFFYFDLN